MEPDEKRSLQEEWKAAQRATPEEETVEPNAPDKGADEGNLGFGGWFGSEANAGPASGDQEAVRLIDLLIDYVRRRQAGGEEADLSGEIDERTVRTIVRHIRNHPLPTGLLGISVLWLLISKQSEGRDEWGAAESSAGEAVGRFADRLEDELVEQVTKGYDHSRKRIGETVQRHPWAAAGTMVVAGLLAGLFLPNRKTDAESEEGGEGGEGI